MIVTCGVGAVDEAVPALAAAFAASAELSDVLTELQHESESRKPDVTNTVSDSNTLQS